MNIQNLNDISQYISFFLREGFVSMQTFSLYLLSALMVIEVFFFGIAWSVSRSGSLSRAITKILMVGMIVMGISHFQTILKTLLDGFFWLGNTLMGARGQGAAAMTGFDEFSLHPAALLEHGRQAGMMLLYHDGPEAWPKMFTLPGMLGLGLIFNFGLIAIQVVCINVIFYAVALMAMIFIPLGIFSPFRDFLNTALRQVVIIAVRIFGLFIIIAVLQEFWQSLNLADLLKDASFEKWLVPYFISLTFLILSYALPRALAAGVGRIQSTGDTAAPVSPGRIYPPAAPGIPGPETHGAGPSQEGTQALLANARAGNTPLPPGHGRPLAASPARSPHPARHQASPEVPSAGPALGQESGPSPAGAGLALTPQQSPAGSPMPASPLSSVGRTVSVPTPAGSAPTIPLPGFRPAAGQGPDQSPQGLFGKKTEQKSNPPGPAPGISMALARTSPHNRKGLQDFIQQIRDMRLEEKKRAAHLEKVRRASGTRASEEKEAGQGTGKVSE